MTDEDVERIEARIARAMAEAGARNELCSIDVLPVTLLELLATWRRCRELEAALDKINEIRNSIIGLQTINWSAHIYPLVAALEAAGIKGMGYDAARPHYATLLERAVSAEDRANKLEAALQYIDAVASKLRQWDALTPPAAMSDFPWCADELDAIIRRARAALEKK